MSRWLGIASTLFLSCCLIAIVNGDKTNAAESAAFEDAAVSEAKKHASQIRSQSNSQTTYQRHRAFKMARPEMSRQGNARLMFEDMVQRAEKKVLQSRRMANTASLEKNSEAMAEALATELLSTSQEVNLRTCYMRFSFTGADNRDNRGNGTQREHKLVISSGSFLLTPSIPGHVVTMPEDTTFSCLKIQCPAKNRYRTFLGIFPSYNSAFCCDMESNPNLPPTRKYAGGYTLHLLPEHVSDSNGIYMSKESCNTGSVYAINSHERQEMCYMRLLRNFRL